MQDRDRTFTVIDNLNNRYLVEERGGSHRDAYIEVALDYDFSVSLLPDGLAQEKIENFHPVTVIDDKNYEWTFTMEDYAMYVEYYYYDISQ